MEQFLRRLSTSLGLGLLLLGMLLGGRFRFEGRISPQIQGATTGPYTLSSTTHLPPTLFLAQTEGALRSRSQILQNQFARLVVPALTLRAKTFIRLTPTFQNPPHLDGWEVFAYPGQTIEGSPALQIAQPLLLTLILPSTAAAAPTSELKVGVCNAQTCSLLPTAVDSAQQQAATALTEFGTVYLFIPSRGQATP